MKKQVNLGNAAIVPRDDYIQTLQAIVVGGFCPFCEEHLFKHHKRDILFTSKYWLVTESSWPYEGATSHFLLIARPHIEKIEEMSAEKWADMQVCYEKLVLKYKLVGATLLIRSGETEITGASVNHLHAHVVVGSTRTEKSKPIEALVGFAK